MDLPNLNLMECFSKKFFRIKIILLRTSKNFTHNKMMNNARAIITHTDEDHFRPYYYLYNLYYV